MELTIEQALQQGVAAHKEGKVQEAKRLYRAILQSQPLHPDANHNLGVLAVSEKQIEAALPLFKTALEVNPMIEQFWLSYIDALVKDNQLETAKAVLEQDRKVGSVGDKIDALEAQLKQIMQSALPKPPAKKKSLTLKEKRKKIAASKQQKNQAKGKNANSLSPSQSQVDNLLEHYQNERYDEAEKLAVTITKKFPKHQFSWKVLGAVLEQSGRSSEAVNANQTAVALSPQDAAAHSNLGNTLKELGRLDEAEASYKQAISLKPDYAEARYNLGITLRELGRLDEAEASYKQAITLKPDYAEAHYNLGNTLNELDRLDEAISAYVQAITLKPNFPEAYANFGKAIKNVTSKSLDRSLYPILINLLTTGNFIRPREVASSILSLLKHDPLIKDLLAEKNGISDKKGVTSAIDVLDKLPLLHRLMRICPLPDLQLEGLFIVMRKILLSHLNEIEESPELIYFLSTLSLQCFTNEYVYFESDEEIQLVDDLEIKIVQTMVQTELPRLIEVLCLSSYRPLHYYGWCKNLGVLDQLTEVKARLIEQPIAEIAIAKNVPLLGEISDEVSLKVREQYEENPYPRWVKLAIPIRTQSVAEVCDHLKLQLHSENIKDTVAPIILIAGCGTGQHSITTASTFPDCQVLAVDLSFSSLAYAQRKSTELEFNNLNYLQADILDLHRLDREFDIIESSGVLHHMEDPMGGWKVLTDILKPGGLMNIGLYSELARRHIIKIRKEIDLLKVGTSQAEIRKFRQSLIEFQNESLQKLISFSDFYSLSELRDLIFHVQEHRFNLLQIRDCLDELGLKFCGFEDKNIVSRFTEFHGEGSDSCDLALWYQFEENNPDTFTGMYQFWCQKL